MLRDTIIYAGSSRGVRMYSVTYSTSGRERIPISLYSVVTAVRARHDETL